jgi:hypothetical protein
MKLLEDLKSKGEDFVSDTERSANAERIYARLRKAGVPLGSELNSPRGASVCHSREGLGEVRPGEDVCQAR